MHPFVEFTHLCNYQRSEFALKRSCSIQRTHQLSPSAPFFLQRNKAKAIPHLRWATPTLPRSPGSPEPGERILFPQPLGLVWERLCLTAPPKVLAWLWKFENQPSKGKLRGSVVTKIQSKDSNLCHHNIDSYSIQGLLLNILYVVNDY